MSVVAIVVFVVAYALIASDRVNKTLVALAGAAIVVALPVIRSDDVFYSRDTGIDWDVIFLLLGMMIIVSVLRQTGVFEYTAIWAAKRASGSPLRIMILLVLVTAFASALLDNVTTVLLIAPVTLLVCDRLAIGPAPFLMAEVFASNIGGTATLIGDPPSIIIASRAGLSFNDFLIHLTPIVIIIIGVFVALLPRLFPGAFHVDPERVADVMSLEEREAIRDPRLLIKCGVVLMAVLIGFVAHSALHMEPSLVALLGAGILIVISGLEHSDYLSSVEWDTLLFFAGLFVMVGALVKTGVVNDLAQLATDSDRRARPVDDDVDPGGVVRAQRHHQQRPVCGDDGADRRAVGPVNGGPGTRRCCGGLLPWAPTSAATSPPWAPAPTWSSWESRNAPTARSPSGNSPARARSSRRSPLRCPRSTCGCVFRVGLRRALTGQQRNAFGVMGQRECVEHPDLLDEVTMTAVQADITRERRCLTADVDHPGNPGGGQ